LLMITIKGRFIVNFIMLERILNVFIFVIVLAILFVRGPEHNKHLSVAPYAFGDTISS